VGKLRITLEGDRVGIRTKAFPQILTATNGGYNIRVSREEFDAALDEYLYNRGLIQDLVEREMGTDSKEGKRKQNGECCA